MQGKTYTSYGLRLKALLRLSGLSLEVSDERFLFDLKRAKSLKVNFNLRADLRSTQQNKKRMITLARVSLSDDRSEFVALRSASMDLMRSRRAAFSLLRLRWVSSSAVSAEASGVGLASETSVSYRC